MTEQNKTHDKFASKDGLDGVETVETLKAEQEKLLNEIAKRGERICQLQRREDWLETELDRTQQRLQRFLRVFTEYPPQKLGDVLAVTIHIDRMCLDTAKIGKQPIFNEAMEQMLEQLYRKPSNGPDQGRRASDSKQP
jgi:chromosome segregation ATPase